MSSAAKVKPVGVAVGSVEGAWPEAEGAGEPGRDVDVVVDVGAASDGADAAGRGVGEGPAHAARSSTAAPASAADPPRRCDSDTSGNPHRTRGPVPFRTEDFEMSIRWGLDNAQRSGPS